MAVEDTIDQARAATEQAIRTVVNIGFDEATEGRRHAFVAELVTHLAAALSGLEKARAAIIMRAT
jgi:hypothetical protein